MRRSPLESLDEYSCAHEGAKIVQSMFSNHSEIKLEINNRYLKKVGELILDQRKNTSFVATRNK